MKRNTYKDEKSAPWPKAGDKLFQSGDDWWHNACVNYGCHPWELYATGYKDAADVLAERVFETRRHADFLIYPIAFLYRHYLELRLKEIIVAGQALLDHPSDFEHVHQLEVLWDSCRKILEEVWPGSPAGDLNAVEDCIRQFSKVDPRSMGFRYPATKDGKATLPNLQRINIRNLHEVMARLSSLLEGASMGISVYLDDKRSMERDCYG
jgi:hypothetical protein